APVPPLVETFSLSFVDLLFDFSKHVITAETVKLLIALAEERKVRSSLEAMFSGSRFNVTENRSVLHVALRERSGRSILVDGKDVMPDVRRVLEKIRGFS